MIDPFRDYIISRMNGGMEHTKTMLKELRDNGYTGSETTLKNFMRPYRKLKTSQAKPPEDPRYRGGQMTLKTNEPTNETPPEERPRKVEDTHPGTIMRMSPWLDDMLGTRQLPGQREMRDTVIANDVNDDSGLLARGRKDELCQVAATAKGTLYAQRWPPRGEEQVLIIGQLPEPRNGLEECVRRLGASNAASVNDYAKMVEQLTSDALPQRAKAPESEKAAAVEREKATLTVATLVAVAAATLQTTTALEVTATGTPADRKPQASHQPAGEEELLARAWNIANPARFLSLEDIETEVATVHNKLLEAALPGKAAQDRETDLGKGYAVGDANRTGPEGHSQVTISKTHASGKRSGTIGATTGGDGRPGIMNLHFPEHIVWWEPKDGEQETWIRQHLERNAAAFIEENG